MPSVRHFVQNMTGLSVQRGLVDPDAAVASGAAVYAGVLSGHISELMVMDVWQAALMRALAENELKTNQDTREAVFGDEDEPDTDSDVDSDVDTYSDSSSDGSIVPEVTNEVVDSQDGDHAITTKSDKVA